MKLPAGQSIAIGRRYIDIDQDIIVAILRIVIEGWEILLSNQAIAMTTGEVAITEQLRDAMRMAVRQSLWRKKMIVSPGTESRSQAGMIAPDGRTDIPIYLVCVFDELEEHDPHAILECKRVQEGDSHLTREYVVEGIDRFRTGKYGENHGHGFMVGYLLAGSPAVVVNEINTYLIKYSRAPEMLSPSSRVGLSGGWDSEHPRATPRGPIALHHAMLALSQ